jgi:hypothetical protein
MSGAHHRAALDAGMPLCLHVERSGPAPVRANVRLHQFEIWQLIHPANGGKGRMLMTWLSTFGSLSTLCVLSLLILSACRHPESPAHSRRLELPEKRSTEAEIAQHIVGEWKIADNSDGCWYPVMIIAQDGTLTGAQSSGTKVLLGTWEFANHALRVTPTPARLKAARASGSWMNDWDWYPVVYADDHELVMTPGISMAGRWRYKR